MLKLRVWVCAWPREAKKTEREKMAEDERRLADADVLVKILWKTVFHDGGENHFGVLRKSVERKLSFVAYWI